MRIAASLIALAIAAPVSAQTIAVTHAEAWTLEGDAPVRDATIVIAGGKIVSVTPGGAVPEGASVIDARGRPVTPGFVNAATQIGLVEVSGSGDTRDMASADERNAGFDMSSALNGNSTLVSLARADGITRALVYPSPSRFAPFSGEASMVRLRDGVDIRDAADVGVYAVIGGGAWDRLGSRAVQWTALRKALLDARPEPTPQKGKGRKGKGGGPPPGKRAGEQLIRAVLRGDVPLAIQTHRESDIRQAAALAREFGIRVVIVGGTEAWRAADELAAAKVAVVLDPQVNLPGSFDQLGARQDNAILLRRAGVAIAIGQAGGAIHSNYNAGMALREGAGLAVSNGLSWIEGLRAVTTAPLAIWGRGGGTLIPGADADLVVWDGDPLEPSSIAVRVIIEGREVSNRSRQDVLAERYRDAR
ncbi:MULTISPECIES: amidohydrolase family protein [unclassified Sphingomonas]|uniref:amidohydrolase family protein n=1 Tax=unclassified Sphingomonas TaxID=196159 RepID=UPI002150F2FB|nr:MULTISPECIES: amidohydrolase family protein [unclassified Sphingomonas]MCR5871226.1 amidohydrolase family protein [Sphingomonas sp. J344]UUY00464.1 amidohydrolase family protein [Sphingomonas sp. J315]